MAKRGTASKKSVLFRMTILEPLALTCDAWAEWYDATQGGIFDGTARIQQALRKIPGLDALEQATALDLGCGTGLSSAAIASLGYNVTGVDISGNSIDFAKTRVDPLSQNTSFELGDAAQLSFADGSFDLVSAIRGPYHYFLSDKALRAAFRESARVLKPGGTLIFDSHDYATLLATEAEDHCTLPLPVPHADSPGTTAFVFERRLWRDATRRDRCHTSEFYWVEAAGETRVARTECRATTMDEYTALLKESGFGNIEWIPPRQTGHSLWFCKATKRSETATLDEPGWTDLGEFEQPEDLGLNPFEEAPGHRRNALVGRKDEGGKVNIVRRRQSTLVALSGGIDSVYTLTRLLRESDDEIFAHHVHYITPDKRSKAEGLACAKVVDYLRKTERDFFYTESAVDRHRFRGYGVDEVAIGFEVGIVARSFYAERGYPLDRWTGGICLEEELNEAGPSDTSQLGHTLNCVAAACNPVSPPRFFQLKIVPKADQIAYMGLVLADLCWTCRRPVWGEDGQPRECGKCHTCILMNGIRNGRKTIDWQMPRQDLTDARIRALKPGDAPRMEELLEARRDELAVSSTKGKASGPASGSGKRGEGFVSVVSGRVTGILTYTQLPDPRTGQDIYRIGDLYIEEPYRRHGMARGLMAALCRQARKEGVAQIDWDVDRHDAAARAFFIGLCPESFRPDRTLYRMNGKDITETAGLLPDRFILDG